MRRFQLHALGLAVLVACTGGPDDGEEPGPLQVGIATRRMPVPVGIGTVGYGGFGTTPNPTPFNEIYPGTEHIHGHPDFKAVVFSRGPGHEVALLRSDTVGVFQHFRQAVVLELERRMGRDMDDVLLIGATHTHSGPGRVIDAEGPFALIADTFFPEFYDRMVLAMADTVEAAYADLAPARLGHAVAWPAEAHEDRRCEDGESRTVDDAPILVVERDGVIDAVITSFAVHGTALGIDQLTLSQDVHGAIEEAVEDRFDHPVEALSFNSWGADMRPRHPAVPAGGSPQPSNFEGMESLGTVVAEAVQGALDEVVWSEDPAVWMDTHRFILSRDAIGYEEGVWEHPYGAVYCGGNVTVEDCDPETVATGIDSQCVEFPSDFPAPDRTIASVGALGDWHFLTWPGEPGTELIEDLLAQARTRPGVGDVMLFGYAQDYNGYSLHEDDWWQGGYEASGALWGPRQGDYTAERILDALDRSLSGWDETRGFEPGPLPPFDAGEYEPRVATTPTDPGTVAVDVQATYAPGDVVTITVRGHDPWLGAPVARLERLDGAVVSRPNGMVRDSDGYGWWVDLDTDPTYRSEPDAAQRAFLWTFNAPVTHAAPGWDDLSGSYRVVVTLADGTEVRSAEFTVTP